MTIKDYVEIAYWAVSLAILGVTVYWIAKSPIMAVETGRNLDNEQNKYSTKRDLFLTLFSLRGNPTHFEFVRGLNQIDIVFQDEEKVLAAWEKLYESLGNTNLTNEVQTWDLLRTDLLSEMAQSLGYQKLKQTSIQRNYSPQAHANQDNENWNYHQAAKIYFETGAEIYKLQIAQFKNTDKIQENKN